MWLVNPSLLCRNHLLGEHRELHTFIGTIKKGISVQGYLDYGLLEPSKLNERHEELITEMARRGYSHYSPLEVIDVRSLGIGKVDPKANLIELAKRCPECRRLQNADR